MTRTSLRFLIVATLFFATSTSHAQQSISSEGTDYWLAFIPNWDAPAEAVKLTLASRSRNTVMIEYFGGGTGKVTRTDTLTVNPTSALTVDLNAYLAETRIPEIASYAAVRVRALAPIQVYGFSQGQLTSEGFLAIPSPALGRKYVVASYYDDSYSFLPESPCAGEFAVIALHDSTQVTIQTRADTRNVGGSLSHKLGSTWSVTLQRGQTYLVQSTGKWKRVQDLSGSTITSNVPVAVVCGHQRAMVAGEGTEDLTRHHLLEMLPPVELWGTEYFEVPSYGRTKCGDYVRLMAAENQTTIREAGRTSMLLNEGEWIERPLQLEMARYTSDSAKPFMVVRYGYSGTYNLDPGVGDPFLSYLPSRESFQTSQLFAIPTLTGSQQHFVTVIAESSSINSIQLFDKPLAAYAPVRSAVAFPGLPEYSDVILKLQSGLYTMKGPRPFGVYLQGFSNTEGYGYPAAVGLNLSLPDERVPRATIQSNCGTFEVILDDGPQGSQIAVAELI